MTCKAILVGLDGATFSILDPLMAQGVMPFLKSFVASGVRANLRSIIPPLTPPAWTSLMTGRSPGHHGIFDFFQLDLPDNPRIRLATSKDVRCKTIWNLANDHGLRATVLNFPVTFPPPALDGRVISGWMPWRQLRLGCHPPDLYDRLKALPGFSAREMAMDMGLESKATEGCGEDEYADWITLHIRREQHWLEVLRYLLQAEASEAVAILFDGPDKIQHLCWRFLDPALWSLHPTNEEQQIRELCFDYFRQLDGVLAGIAALVGSEATMIIASFFYCSATTEIFHVNTWLEQAGHLTWTQAHAPERDVSGTLGMSHLTRHMQWLDWEKTTAYASTPTSNGIHIVTASSHSPKGVPPEDYMQFREALIQALYRVVDLLTGEPIVTRIWTREEAFFGPAMSLAPDLTLALRDGGLISILPSDPPLKTRPQLAGAHRPLGVFMMRGPGTQRSLALDELSLLDVAPILLYSLDLGIPEDLEGHVPVEAYERSFRAEKPIEIVPATHQHPQPLAEPGGITGYDEEAEAILLTRLKDLGYIE